MLTNVIYFKGAWQREFDKADTKDEDFHVNPNYKLKAATMHQLTSFNYTETEGMQLLEIPYEGNKLSMLVLLPKTMNDMVALENNLSAKKIEDWRDKLEFARIDLSIPKFTFRTRYDAVAKLLKTMGMPTAFTPQANFSGIAPIDPFPLAISDIIHQTFIEVNEKTTEATAATGVIMRLATSSAYPPPPPIIFRADHPFIFLIQNTANGNILFVGRVNDPSKN